MSRYNISPRLGICVLNFNGSSDTIDCINSIIKNDFERFSTIFVLDNGSHASDYDKLRLYLKENDNITVEEMTVAAFENEQEFNKDIYLIKSEFNYGFAGGNNILLRQIMKNGFKYALLLNNDTVIVKHAISNCLKYLDKNKNIGVATVNVCYYEKPEISWSAGSKILTFGHRKYLSDKYIQSCLKRKKYVTSVKFITGCFLMTRTDVLKKYGVLSENFFLVKKIIILR